MTQAFKQVGLIINACAGRHSTHCFLAASQALNALAVQKVITGPGSIGENAITDTELDLQICSISPTTGREATKALAQVLADLALDTVIVVGGDGTMADVAGVFMNAPKQPNILGIGAGSTNAGALITCKADEVSQLDASTLKLQSIDSLMVSIDDVPSALAFNDCVFSTTVVGTLDGQLIDIDAAALLDERCEPGTPECIGTKETDVKVITSDRTINLADGQAVGTIIVGFAEQTFRAKAITGGICLATHVGLSTGCLVADQPIAYLGATSESLLDNGPLQTNFMGLDADSKIIVSKVRNGIIICADGNPVARLDKSSVVQIQNKPSAIGSYKIQEKSS